MPRRKGVPFARKDQLKTRKNVSLTQKAIAGLVVWYKRLSFPSLSHMLEALGRNELFLLKADSPEVTFQILLGEMDLEQLASQSSISTERLLAIADGALPSAPELTKLSRALSADMDYLTEEIKQFLEAWALEEDCSVSELVASVVVEAVKQKQKEQLQDNILITEDDDEQQA